MSIINRLLGWKVGGIVRMGNPGNGVGKIQWRILAVDQQKHKALVISAKPVTTSVFHSGCEALFNQKGTLYWSNCSLREKLNGNIYDSAFSPKEKEAILTTAVRDGDNATVQDKLFLLSEKEAREYFSDDASRATTGSAWWLRDTENAAWFSAKLVYTNGEIKGGTGLADEVFSVRPAMWLDLSKL